jgi:hypothetical protein
MSIILDFLIFFAITLIIYILPGWVLLSIIEDKLSLGFAERFCLSAGVSISLIAVIFHIFFHLKIAIDAAIGWFSILAALFFLGAIQLYRRLVKTTVQVKYVSKDTFPHARPAKDFLFNLIFTTTVLLLIITRFGVIQGMIAPSWGDSVNHTLIVQLIRESGGLFQSWTPYAPINTMTYHFGFHTAAVVWAWIAHVSSHVSVLAVGQVFGFLSILVLYPLSVRISRNRWVGIAVMLVAGFLSPLPAFYTNWGRYPKLAGLIVGLTVLYFIDVLFTAKGRSSFLDWSWFSFLFIILISGLWLSHYRLSILIMAGAFVWLIDSLWDKRGDFKEWFRRILILTSCVGGAALLLYPWIKITFSNKMIAAVLGSRGANFKQVASYSDIGLWKHLDFYYPSIFLILLLLCVIPALVFLPRLTRIFVLWAAFAFLVSNPDLLGFSWGLGWLRNENLVFVFFLLFSAIIGGILGLIWQKLRQKTSGTVVLCLSLALLLVLGLRIQWQIINPFFQMVEPSDVTAFRWIRQNTPQKSRFLVNGFVIGEGNMAFGSDAGWWLPYFTHRENTVPPSQYSMEALSPDIDKLSFARIIKEVRASEGKPGELKDVLCREGISHVYLGEKRGAVGYEIQELIPESWLRGNPDFTLLFSEGEAQVWRFDRGGCRLP